MSWYNWIIYTFLSIIVIFIQLKTFQKISDKYDQKLTFSNALLVILCSIIITYNTIMNENASRAYISFVLLLILEKIIYQESLTRTLIYGIICYVVAIFSEIIIDILLLVTNIVNLKTLDSNIIMKIIFSIVIILPPYFIVKNKTFKKISNKIISMLEKSVTFLYIMIFALIAILAIAFKNISNLTYTNYVMNLILLVIFVVFLIMIIYNEQKIKKEIEKTETLLDFMTNYEKKIDEDRINRHEMLNNLLILRSYKNKNSKEYNEILNELINKYNNSGTNFKNIYKLPSGLKGILYYKIKDIKNKKINILINISKQLSDHLKKLDSKTYTIMCKIVAITFDNAIEAAMESKEKIINFDVYNELNNIVIEIGNTFKNKIELNKLDAKNYSTKGKGRGLGLYVVKNMLVNINNIKMKQDVNDNMFITKIFIKSKKSRQ